MNNQTRIRAIETQYAKLRAAFDNAENDLETEVAFVRLGNWLWDNQQAILTTLRTTEARVARLEEALSRISKMAPDEAHDDGITMWAEYFDDVRQAARAALEDTK